MSKTKILVVEDEGVVALSIQKKLINLGYEVPAMVASGQEAILQATKTQPHLVLMDIMLAGDMDGIEAAAHIRATLDIPIIYLTANSDDKTLQRAKNTQPHGYLLKPFEDRELYTVVEMALSRHQMEKQLKENEQWLATTLKSIGDGVITTDKAGVITFMNREAQQLTGWMLVEAVGKPLEDIFKVFDEETTSSIDNPVIKALQQGYASSQAKFYTLIDRDKTEISIEYNANPIRDDTQQITGVVVAFRDVSQRKQAEERLEQYRDHLEELVTERTFELSRANEQLQREINRRQQLEEQLLYEALYNKLTSLPNQALFTDHLQRAITQAAHNPSHLFAVLLLDLDRFQRVNDSHGHPFGDKVLAKVAQRLTDCLYPEDIAAYLGGDEFAVLLSHIHNADEVITSANKINEAIGQRMMVEGQEIVTTASIGIVLSQDHAFGQRYYHPADMFRDADTAMYEAKAQGRNQAVLFDVGMRARTVAILELETDLRLALEDRQFQIFYQPIVSLTTGKMVGVESLLRWQHPHNGFISPTEFVPVLEETRLILSLGEWILEQSCQQLRAWHSAGYSDLRGAINLSVHQLRESTLPTTVQTILTQTELAASAIEVEITESMAMQHADFSLQALQRLHHLGLHISIDDFGTGYSSLGRLKQMPVNTLKIDQSFVRHIPDRSDDIAIIKAIIALAHALNLKVLAEGVETQEQLDLLKSLGCDEAQGYLFSHAVPAEEITKLLAKGQPLGI